MEKRQNIKRKINSINIKITKHKSEIKRLQQDLRILELEESFLFLEEIKKELGNNLSNDELKEILKGELNE